MSAPHTTAHLPAPIHRQREEREEEEGEREGEREGVVEVEKGEREKVMEVRAASHPRTRKEDEMDLVELRTHSPASQGVCPPPSQTSSFQSTPALAVRQIAVCLSPPASLSPPWRAVP